MDNPDITVARLAADGHGMIIRSQALDTGLTADEYRERKESGLLVPVHRGITRHAAVPLTWQGRLAAAVLAGGAGAVASHRSAGRLHDLRGIPRWRPEVTVTGSDLPRASGIHFHRTNLLSELDRTTVDGIPCTSLARTLLDLGAVLPYEMVELAAQDAVIRRLVTPAQLVSVLERVGGRGRRGTAPLRAAVDGALPDDRIESELERVLWLLLPPNHGLTFQLELTCSDGRRVRLDSGCPVRRISIEANGRRWHATARDVRRDMERRRSIQATGWSHYEFGWSDATELAAATRADLARLLT